MADGIDNVLTLFISGSGIPVEVNESAAPLGSHYTGVVDIGGNKTAAVSMHIDLIEVAKVPDEFGNDDIRSICTDSGYQRTVEAYWALNGDEPPALFEFNGGRTYLLLIYPFAE